MSREPDINLTPSAEGFRGWYNIPDQYDDGRPVLRSIDELPEFGFPELWELYQEADKWFGELVPAATKKSFDPMGQPTFFVRDSADDRTLIVDTDFDYLTLSLIHRVQQEFLTRWPLWRIALAGEDASNAIMIYPTAIRFGSLPANADPKAALRELVQRVAELRTARERPRREWISQIQQLLPGAVKAIDDQPYLIAGILANYAGDHNRLTICLLIRGSDSDAIRIENPTGAAEHFFSVDSAFGIDVQGRIASYIDVPKISPFCLRPWMPPADYRGPLTIVEEGSGRQHTIKIRTEDIIRS